MNRITFAKVNFTEQTAEQVCAAHPGNSTTSAVRDAANDFLRRRWDETTGERVHSTADSFAQFAAFCKRYPSASYLAFNAHLDEDAMPLVSVEEA
jgi:hypothetical protein